MNSTQELADWYASVRNDDLLGFVGEVVIPYLPYGLAKPYLKDEVAEADWKPEPLTEDAVLAEMQKYMEFAWGKVENHRGLSAGRSVDKMKAWLVLLGKEEVIVGVPYENYGAPILAKICEHFSFPISESEKIRHMAAGLPCHDGCDEGCGK